MKKCPTCGKTFDDNMRFCQVDGTPLVDDAPAAAPEPPAAEEPAFDPYATIVGVPKAGASEPSSGGEVVLEPVATSDAGPASSADASSETPTAGSIPVPSPDDVLDLGQDPLKTMYVSDAEMKEVLGTAGDGADTPAEEMKADEAQAETPAPPSFGDMTPPPSPFSTPAPPDEAPVPAPPSFLEQQEATPQSEARTQLQEQPPFDPEPSFQEAPTIYQPMPESAAAPMQQQEWTPPPAPNAEWQNQQIGSNTPFQPPPAGTAGQNKTLAIVSLVLGILSVCCYVAPITGLAALITGFMANKKANADPQNFGGKGLALAGMITGGVFFLLGVVYWIYVIFVIGFAAMNGGFR